MSWNARVPVAALALALLPALAACQPAARASSAQRVEAPPAEEAPQAWPTSLVLAIGEQVALPGGRLHLQRIAADSRCPKDVQCVWAGEVTLAFVFTPKAGAAREFQLSQRGAPRTSLGDHDIELTAFGPCPAGHTPASPAGCASVAFSTSEMR